MTRTKRKLRLLATIVEESNEDINRLREEENKLNSFSGGEGIETNNDVSSSSDSNEYFNKDTQTENISGNDPPPITENIPATEYITIFENSGNRDIEQSETVTLEENKNSIKTNSSEKQIQLSKLDFSASGSYSCVVSMDTPIFTKDSESKDLTVIEPQDSDPEITFNKSTYEIGEVLEANCTTASSRPPPHITWLINNEKVPDKLTKSFSNGMIHGHGYFEQKTFAIKQLSVEVSDLHVGDDGQLTLTCISTIPGYISSLDTYADLRTATAHIDIELTEGPVGEAISNVTPNATSWRTCLNFSLVSLSLLASCLV